MDTTLVAESPGLTWASNPRVELNHLGAVQQVSTLEEGSGCCSSSVVATIGTGVLLAS